MKKARKNKKGILRVIESIIGVIIILLALIYFVSQQTKNIGKEEKAKETLSVILNEVEKNDTIRQYIITNDIVNINNSLLSLFSAVAPFYQFNFCVEKPELICVPELPKDKDIFSDSVFITDVGESGLNATKLTVFIWAK